MIGAKEYHAVDEVELMEIFDTVEIAESEEKLRDVISDLPESYFNTEVFHKRMFCTDICLTGKPEYRIFWQIAAAGKHLHICASLFIGENPNNSLWGAGAEKIARLQGCAAVTFSTCRRGHIIAAQTWGAEITGVTMKKVLS
jgi:hypothetical protein